MEVMTQAGGPFPSFITTSRVWTNNKNRERSTASEYIPYFFFVFHLTRVLRLKRS